MLASINWLKDYVDINVTPEVLADKLTGVGLEVERVIHLGEGIEGVITGKVETIERHPNSDHLWICMMNLGQGDLVQILTGAQNVHQYDMVPVAVVGSRLPNGMKLKKAKMRGLDSFGMLCSAEELGIDAKLLLPEQRNGIYILPPDTPIGVDIKPVLGLDDVVLDIDLTANRGDCFNMLGLAREAAAVLDKPMTMPDLTVEEKAGGDVKTMATIKVEAKDLCSRFAMKLLKNIKIAPSPVWMQNHLRAAGMRPINNVVDVTNFVMLEEGQPMHAYDYDKVADHTWIVRRGGDGEKLVTLDEQERSLNHNMITIADPEKAIGLGGVMGGLLTEVTYDTVNVMLESATFNGPSIRHTSKDLGLRSEASQRFERGVDTVLNHDALNRCANLLEKMGACETVGGIVEDYPVEVKPVVIKVTAEAINSRLGTDVSKAEMIAILKKLAFAVTETPDGALSVTAPTWRLDVTCDADISEEIARMHGFEKLPSTLPKLEITQGTQKPIEDVKDAIRDYLTGAGFNEVMTYSFIHANNFDKLHLGADDIRRKAINIMNPISDEFKTMRTTMAPSILSTVAYNLARQNDRVDIFEIGRIYVPKELPLTEFPEEKPVLCLALSGRRTPIQWNDSKDNVDFFDVKGVFEGLMDLVSAKDYQLVPGTEPFLHPGKSCDIIYDGKKSGYFGEVHPEVQNSFALSGETYLMEIAVEPLLAQALVVPQYKSVPQFPSSSRDIAVVVPEDTPEADLETVLRKNAGKLLTNIKLFDVYKGKQVTDGCKSMAFNLTFQDKAKTLVDADVDAIIKKVLADVESAFKAKLRD